MGEYEREREIGRKTIEGKVGKGNEEIDAGRDRGHTRVP